MVAAMLRLDQAPSRRCPLALIPALGGGTRVGLGGGTGAGLGGAGAGLGGGAGAGLGGVAGAGPGGGAGAGLQGGASAGLGDGAGVTRDAALGSARAHWMSLLLNRSEPWEPTYRALFLQAKRRNNCFWELYKHVWMLVLGLKQCVCVPHLYARQIAETHREVRKTSSDVHHCQRKCVKGVETNTTKYLHLKQHKGTCAGYLQKRAESVGSDAQD